MERSFLTKLVGAVRRKQAESKQFNKEACAVNPTEDNELRLKGTIPDVFVFSETSLKILYNIFDDPTTTLQLYLSQELLQLCTSSPDLRKHENNNDHHFYCITSWSSWPTTSWWWYNKYEYEYIDISFSSDCYWRWITINEIDIFGMLYMHQKIQKRYNHIMFTSM